MEAALATQVERWVTGGVDWVQLREKDLPRPALCSLLQQLARVTRQAGSRTRLLVNGLAPEDAHACGADGVHLPGGASVAAVASALRAAGLATVSCHTLGELHAARDGGATAVLWAPVFGKTLHGKPVQDGTGLRTLGEACAAAGPMPVFALGGVSVERAASCMAAGAAGVAGIRLFHGEGWQRLVGTHPG